MIENIKLSEDFSAVPYLPGSQLWQNTKKKGLDLSLSKPNVVVGPNGSGKTALLTLLALQTWSYFTGKTTFDDNYIRSGRFCDEWWSERTWREDPVFLPGATFKTDNAPAVFYRPGHLPGNEKCAVTALMVGYSDEAHTYMDAVDNKSSGQGCQALLARLRNALAAPAETFGFAYANWSEGKECRDLTGKGWVGPWAYRAEVMKARRDAYQGGIPLILLDEPEQSLDTRAELALWQAIVAANCATRQIVLATHSLYPFLHPERFNMIEAEPGYLASVQAELRIDSRLPASGC